MSLGPEADLIPVRMLTQYTYCKRLGYMEWVQGEFAYNEDVVDGRYQHRSVDKASGRKKMEDSAEEKIHARSVMLSDTKLGLISKIDLIEIEGDNATPVEYKRGSAPEADKGVYDDHRVQVCAQGLLLRANGYRCDKGVVYYISSKQRIEVPLDDKTVADTLGLISEMRDTVSSGTIPPPLIDSPKCSRCSMVGICLPDETNMLSDRTADKTSQDQVRRMYPIRNDTIPVYVQEQGAYVSKSGECIHVKMQGEVVRKVRLMDISEVVVYGNVQLSTQAVRELCSRNIPVCYMTYGGWFVGMTSGLAHKNIELRMAQHARHVEKESSMSIAREIVFGKIKNCSTLLRRNHKGLDGDTIKKLDTLAASARTAKQYEVLLGTEGMAARLYFAKFGGMIKSESMCFDFNGRNRRPPRDPVNAILSFLYSMLVRQAMTTVSMVGLDPYLGYLHRPKYGKPALALDLIEEYRPIVADSTCITLINNGEITDTDVIGTSFGVNLTSTGRRAVITAYERRMNSTVTHHLLGYSASYKRIMETQARLLSRCILGEIPSYPPFRTR